SLQGRSFFGLEHLADGKTERLHGYSLIRVATQDRASLSIAPRQAVHRPSGGYTFVPERGEAWFVPKGTDWSAELSLNMSRVRAEAQTTSSRANKQDSKHPLSSANQLL